MELKHFITFPGTSAADLAVFSAAATAVLAMSEDLRAISAPPAAVLKK